MAGTSMPGGVDLESAFGWTCNSCGKRNYVDAVIIEVTPDEMRQQARKYGGKPSDYRTGKHGIVPSRVVCDACGLGDNVN